MNKKIGAGDFLRFRDIIRRFHPESKYFEFCNGYISQATRNFPRVFYFDDTIVFFTKKGLNKESPYVIVCSAGKNRLNAIRKLAIILYRKTKQKVIIKNVDAKLSKLKKFKEFREYKGDETWDNISKYDDNTFPQLIIDVNKTLDLEDNKFKKLREELSVFDRRFNIKVRKYQKSDKGIFNSLLNKWAPQITKRVDIDKDEVIRATKMFGSFRNEFFQYIIYEKRTKKYIGFLSFSIISESSLGFNALINDFNYKGLYRKLMYEGVKITARLGFEFLNLEGSEVKEQYSSKLKLKPDIKLKRKHLVYSK